MSVAVLTEADAAHEKVVKDFEKILLNYFTGKFDLALAFNTDRLVTHQCNSAGIPLTTYNSATGAELPSDSAVVVDNAGNVVVLGSGASSY